MTYAVIYFSRTGTSRRIAEKIAKKLSVEPIEVTDNVDWGRYSRLYACSTLCDEE